MYPSLPIDMLSSWPGQFPGIMTLEMQSSKEMPKTRGEKREIQRGTHLSLLSMKMAPSLWDRSTLTKHLERGVEDQNTNALIPMTNISTRDLNQHSLVHILTCFCKKLYKVNGRMVVKENKARTITRVTLNQILAWSSLSHYS